MISFKKCLLAPLVAFIAFVSLAPSLLEAKPYLLKIASLAPEGSFWIKTLRQIDAELRDQTGEAVGLKIYPGGVQGDEDVMIRKIRVGQLHGGGFAGLGISQINPEILALQMPFLFDTHEEIDYVLERMDSYYKQGYKEKGYVLLGWVNIGFVYILAKSPIGKIEDLDGVKVWRLEGEPITAAIFNKAGVQSIPLSISDVLLGLQTNLIEMVYAPPTAAIVLQWFTRVKYRTALPINHTQGAFLVSTKAFSRLTPPQQEILRQIAHRHTQSLSIRSRTENQEAIQVMRDQGIEEIHPSAEAIEAFRHLVKEAQRDLVGKAFSQEAYDQVSIHLEAYRSQNIPTD
jgi:TRAP-type C4-dicarboxylate transport system substrate-binding protein